MKQRNKIIFGEFFAPAILFSSLIFLFSHCFAAESLLDETRNFNSTLLSALAQYRGPAIFLGALIFSEAAILPAFFLSGQELWSPVEVFLLSFLGVMISDIIWFTIGERMIFGRWGKRLVSGAINKVSILYDKLSGEKPFRTLLFGKFLYIPIFITILYVKRKNVKFAKFLINNIAGVIIWLLILLTVGWLSGKGTYNILPVYYNISYAFLASVVFYISFKIIQKWINNRIIANYSKDQENNLLNNQKI